MISQDVVGNTADMDTEIIMAPAPLVDSHAHLDDRRFAAELPAVLQRAREANICRIITVGTDLPSSLQALSLSESCPDLLVGTVGVHPHNAAAAAEAHWPQLEALWQGGAARAVGEIGLDYHYNFSPPRVQRAVFERQLEAAERFSLPVIVHIREAYDDGFALLEQASLPAGGVLHCFSGTPAQCERALALGLHVSLAGIVTFPKAEGLREAARLVPDDRLLVETDAPYLAPVPRRGKRNEPALVVHTARKLAETRGCTLATLCQQTTRNVNTLFGLS